MGTFDFRRLFKRVDGTRPEGFVGIFYGPLPKPEQDSINNAWPSAVTQYGQGGGVQNAWWGNQLPGYTNFIPGVWQSFAPWAQQRNLQLTQNVPLSRGANGTNQTMDAYYGNMLAQQAGTSIDSFQGGIWQRRDN